MSLQQDTHAPLAVPLVEEHHSVGGAVIDQEGREVPITEGMVREACQALEAAEQD